LDRKILKIINKIIKNIKTIENNKIIKNIKTIENNKIIKNIKNDKIY